MSTIHIIGVTILIVAFLGMGGAFLYLGVPVLKDALRSAEWPFVEGIIERSEMEKTIGTGGVLVDFIAPRVAYSYVHQGKTLTGDLIAFGLPDGVSSANFAQGYCDRYPVGTRVRVYFDPTNATTSVLEPGFSMWCLFPIMIACAFVVVGAVVVTLAIRWG